METEKMEAHCTEDMGNGTAIKPENCDICANPFDLINLRPRCLPCCHTFCALCITKMMSDSFISCPTCRIKHYATNVNHFPVNYSLEALVTKFKSMAMPNDASKRENEAKSGVDKLNNLIREQLERQKKLPDEYTQMQNQLADIQTLFQSLLEDHRQQINRIHNLPREQGDSLLDVTLDNEVSLQQLTEEMERTSSLRQEVEQKRQRVLASIARLTQATTNGEIKMALVIAECDRCIAVKDTVFEKCYAVINDNKTVEEARRVLARTQDAVRLTVLTDDIQRKGYSSLIKMSEEIESLLRNHQVFALHRSEGPDGQTPKDRFAKLSISRDGTRKRLHVHHLQENPPPAGAKVVLYEEVSELTGENASLAFLELGWDGSKEQGRLYVRLQPSDTGRARQFALLCTGLRGPTYANTRLLAVCNRGSRSEFVRGGDYQYNNGMGGASLLEGLGRGGEYWRQQVSGSVMAVGSWGDACGAQFIISTGDPGPAQRDDTIFGLVEEGLHVLNAAIKDVRNITSVVVKDCGIVVPL